MKTLHLEINLDSRFLPFLGLSSGSARDTTSYSFMGFEMMPIKICRISLTRLATQIVMQNASLSISRNYSRLGR